MLQGKCIGSYRSKNTGKKMFVFRVTGPDEELAQYVEIQTERFPKGRWKDENGVNYWTSSPSGRIISLAITTNGNVVEDTTDLDLKASGNARYDSIYESIRAQLAGGQGVAVNRQPAAVTAPGAEEELDK